MPGRVCPLCEVIFDYWKIFASSDEVNEISNACKCASIGCAECKKRLAKKVNDELAQMRAKRKEFEKDLKLTKEILLEGSKKAQIKAQTVLDGAVEVVNMYK